MTNEQILKKAIEKAKKNGYEFEYNLKATQYNFYYYAYIFSRDFARAFWGEEKPRWEREDISGKRICLHCKEDIEIRNPSGFCDHLYYPENCKICSAKEWDWQFHLQQMVLEKEPLKYLEQFL